MMFWRMRDRLLPLAGIVADFAQSSAVISWTPRDATPVSGGHGSVRAQRYWGRLSQTAAAIELQPWPAEYRGGSKVSRGAIGGEGSFPVLCTSPAWAVPYMALRWDRPTPGRHSRAAARHRRSVAPGGCHAVETSAVHHLAQE